MNTQVYYIDHVYSTRPRLAKRKPHFFVLRDSLAKRFSFCFMPVVNYGWLGRFHWGIYPSYSIRVF